MRCSSYTLDSSSTIFHFNWTQHNDISRDWLTGENVLLSAYQSRYVAAYAAADKLLALALFYKLCLVGGFSPRSFEIPIGFL